VGREIQKIQKIQIKPFAAMLHGQEVIERITTLAPSLDRERIITNFMSQVADSYGLQQCTQESLLKAMFACCQWGLYPDKIAGEAYIVPFKDKSGNRIATLIPGYRGLMKLARRSGEIAKIDAWIVRADDVFRPVYGTSPGLLHEPTLGSTAPIIAAYAVAHFKNGAVQFDVADEVALAKAKACSPAGRKGEGPWVDFEEAMKRKTPVRSLCKLLPMGRDGDHAIACDEAYELGKLQPLEELPRTIAAQVRVVDEKQLEHDLTTAPDPEPDVPAEPKPVPKPKAKAKTDAVPPTETEPEATPPDVVDKQHGEMMVTFSKLGLEVQTELRAKHHVTMFGGVRELPAKLRNAAYADVAAAMDLQDAEKSDG